MRLAGQLPLTLPQTGDWCATHDGREQSSGRPDLTSYRFRSLIWFLLPS
jgi:hypothetical protein